MNTFSLKSEAQRLGFDLAGIAPAVTPIGLHNFLAWLERGHAGDMGYLARREAAYEHPRHVLDGVRSVVMLGMNYNTKEPGGLGPLRVSGQATSQSDRPDPPQPGVTARVARYAQGSTDYHDLIRERLDLLGELLRHEHPGCRARGIVDTAPLLERDFARLAGLGWFGKNTMLINKRLGSWFFLAALLTDVELEYDAPHEASHCGTCTRCLDACPTQAFVEPYVLDARRCISYLTIEHRGSIPLELRDDMGDWLFGCDVCQDVCPWNRKVPATAEAMFQPRADLAPVGAAEVLSLSPERFRERFGETPLARPRRAGLLRNAAIVLGNSEDRSAIVALQQALDDVEPIVQEAAAWALEKLQNANPLRKDGARAHANAH